MGKRRVSIILITLSVILLCGFAFGEVNLRIDHPLIDLSSTVQLSETGDAETMKEAGEGDQTKEAAGEEEQQDADAVAKEEEANAPKIFTILVREQRVFLNNVAYDSPVLLMNKLQNEMKLTGKSQNEANGPRIILVDDYAAYNTYTEMRDALSKASLRFTEEAAE